MGRGPLRLDHLADVAKISLPAYYGRPKATVQFPLLSQALTEATFNYCCLA